ncbi:MAG: hypothetical protein ACLQME_16730 [Alphaproteobacteria bacterium]
MTSGSTFPQRFTKIDDLSRPDHWYLTAEDECYFLGEYTARRGFAFSATNNLILNFKKPMDRRGRPEWQYKAKAIRTAAAAIRAALEDKARNVVTFVPVPPSKARGDPLYDDRIQRMLAALWPGQPVDIREIVLQTESSEPVHDSDTRPTPDELKGRYTLDRSLLRPTLDTIAIVDDVLTTGAHFRAVKGMLATVFPDSKIVGLFIARRVPEATDMENFDPL